MCKQVMGFFLSFSPSLHPFPSHSLLTHTYFHFICFAIGPLTHTRTKRRFCYSFADELIKAIKNDIAEADRQLSLPEHVVYKDHAFFTGKPVPQTNGSIGNGITANGKVNGHGETENQMNGNCNHSG